MSDGTENWVFLGDSLTEGVGSKRISYVSDLVKLLRQSKNCPVDEVRLRYIDSGNLSQFVQFNLAGYWNADPEAGQQRLCLWNLASEGTTIETDVKWLWIIENLRPTRIFLLRGALESIIRPAALINGSWPFWVPQSWRSYASMDPRCYFSTTWWRQIKQQTINSAKQQLRHYLLNQDKASPLMCTTEVKQHYKNLVIKLKHTSTNFTILSLLPISEIKFPGSQSQFCRVNDELYNLSKELEINYFEWSNFISSHPNMSQLFYLDGFHPNQLGSRVLAQFLFDYIQSEECSKTT